jgi:nucleotide-binding universal stress UspA family protein
MSDRKIIVGIDNSPGSHHAVHWAADEAARTGRQLIVTTVYDWHVAGARFQVGGVYADDIRRVAEGVVEKAVQDATIHAPGITVCGETVVGSAGSVLADCGPDDIVVVGNRGRGGFASLVLGSVGHHVATQAKGTVVVVRGRAAADSGPVVIGLDRAPSDSVLQQGFEEARTRGTDVMVVHAFQLFIIPAAPTGGYPVTEDAKARQSIEVQALNDMVEPWRTKYPDVAVEVQSIEGHPTEVLTRVSQRAQLVVVGHRATGLGHIGLGAVAAQLLHHADCPVMVTRSGAAPTE